MCGLFVIIDSDPEHTAGRCVFTFQIVPVENTVVFTTNDILIYQGNY
jgi:hypothetical protein